MGQEFCLVGGHVHVGRAVRLAAFAGQAQVERLFDFLAAPELGDRFPFEHFEQQMGAAPRRVLFVARDLVAGAHEPAFFAAALPDPHAAQGRAPEAPLILWEFKTRDRLRLVGEPVPQVFEDFSWCDDLARIHTVGGVPGFLEQAKGFDEFRSVHSRQQFGPRLSVSMLA